MKNYCWISVFHFNIHVLFAMNFLKECQQTGERQEDVEPLKPRKKDVEGGIRKTDRQISTFRWIDTILAFLPWENTFLLGRTMVHLSQWTIAKTHGIRRTFRVKPTGEIELRVPGVPRTRLIAPEGCVDERKFEDRALNAESAQKNTTNSKTRQYFRAKSSASACLEC